MLQQSTIQNYSTLQVVRFSNNTGSSLTEITFLTQVPVLLNCLSVGCVLAKQSLLKKENAFLLFLFEYLTIIFPLIIFLTVASHLLFLLYVFFLIICIILTRKDCRRSWLLLQEDIITEEKSSCITLFRAAVNLFTIICILSADFTCFPRRFLKTETYGYGLMDSGVGLFIIIYSLTDSPSKFNRSLRYSIYKVLPFLVLGVGRYLCTYALNYHFQVEEYGTQWNFFMTLSAITLFNNIFLNFVKSIKAIFTSTVILLVIHESCLIMGLQDWILSNATRQDFISGNREGLFSLLGYEILYLCGIMMGHFLPKKNNSFRMYASILPQYFIGFLLFYVLTKLAELSRGVSRRTANAGYIFWILSTSFLTFTNNFISEIILHIGLGEQAKHVDSTSLIIKSINYNGLLFFLLGNILTGFINLSTKTLLMNNAISVLIISTYAFVCSAFIVFLYQKSIRVR